MDRWIVVLEDRRTDAAARVRKERFEEHFAFLQSNFDRIVFSCGLKSAGEAGAGELSHGGLWIVEADSREEVVALYERDPYFQLGLRGDIDVFRAHEGYI